MSDKQTFCFTFKSSKSAVVLCSSKASESLWFLPVCQTSLSDVGICLLQSYLRVKERELPFKRIRRNRKAV